MKAWFLWGKTQLFCFPPTGGALLDEHDAWKTMRLETQLKHRSNLIKNISALVHSTHSLTSHT